MCACACVCACECETCNHESERAGSRRVVAGSSVRVTCVRLIPSERLRCAIGERERERERERV